MTKNHPSDFDGYAKALPDEPLFTLLARDPSMPHLITLWAARRNYDINNKHQPESDRAMIDEAHRIAKEATRWRRENLGAWRK